MSKCGSITVENLRTSITTELNPESVSGSLFTYTMPFTMPGSVGYAGEISMTVENLKTSITVKCNG